MTRNFPSFEFYCAQTFLTWSLLGSLTHILSFANFSDPIIMSFYLQRGFIHCAPFWKLVQIGNLMKICHILQPSKFVLGHPSRGLFSTTMTRQCPGLSANPGVTDIAHISTLIAQQCGGYPPPPSPLPPAEEKPHPAACLLLRGEVAKISNYGAADLMRLCKLFLRAIHEDS